MAPNIVVHSSPADFLTAVVEAGDLPLTNTSLGPVFELWAGIAAGGSPGQDDAQDAKLQLLVTVWEDEQLKCVSSLVALVALANAEVVQAHLLTARKEEE